MSIFSSIQTWMKAVDQTASPETAELYLKLIDEEYNELKDAQTPIEKLDAMIDLIWVTIGAAHAHGWDTEGAFYEVLRSNYSKLGGPIGPDGKRLKGPNYVPPNLTPYI